MLIESLCSKRRRERRRIGGRRLARTGAMRCAVAGATSRRRTATPVESDTFGTCRYGEDTRRGG